MTLHEIKTAVRAGKTVHWANTNYRVTRSENRKQEDFHILCDNGHCIGLTWQDEVTMNGKPEEFFIAGTKDNSPRLTFDGFGVNDAADPYYARVATLTPHGQTANVGSLMAAAPDLLRALQEIVRLCESDPDDLETMDKGVRIAIQAIAAATQVNAPQSIAEGVATLRKAGAL